MRFGKLPLASLVLSLYAVPAAVHAQSLYGITFGNQLITINPTTGAGTLVGSLDSNMLAVGLGVTQGNLYAYDQVAERIQQLDPATGHTLATINIGAGSFIGEGDLVFNSTGTGYLSIFTVSTSDPPVLYDFSLPPTSLQSRLTTDLFDGLAFNSSDVLYGLTQNTKNLFIINPTTGAETLVGNTGISGGTLGGLAFAPNGTLYAEVSNGATSALYTLNMTTGASTLVGNVGFSNVSGIRFLSPAAVTPEPGSIAILLGLTTTGAGFLSRRRKAVRNAA